VRLSFANGLSGADTAIAPTPPPLTPLVQPLRVLRLPLPLPLELGEAGFDGSPSVGERLGSRADPGVVRNPVRPRPTGGGARQSELRARQAC
jgi:hypothetical protein